MTARVRVVHELRLFFVALQFLTRVPIPRWVGHEPGWLNECVRYFRWWVRSSAHSARR